MPTHNEEVCIKLEYNPGGIGVQKEFHISRQWLEQPESATEILQLSDTEQICIIKNGGLLIINCVTSVEMAEKLAPVDVTIFDLKSILGLQVVTKGKCTIAFSLDLPEGSYIYSSNLLVNGVLKSLAFMALQTLTGDGHSIQFNQPAVTKKLSVFTPALNIDAEVIADVTAIPKCKLFVSPKGCLLVKGGTFGSVFQSETAPSPDIFKQWRKDLKSLICKGHESSIATSEIVNAGIISLVSTQFASSSLIRFLPGSKTTLKHCKLYAKKFAIDKKAKVDGHDTHIQVDGKLVVDGMCVINRLSTYAQSAEINGVYYGEEKLDIEIEELASVFGVLGAEDTSLTSKLMFVSGVDFEYFRSFRKGGVVGVKKLRLNGVATMIAACGYVSASTVEKDIGLWINMAGITWAFDDVHRTLLDVNLGLDLPWFPESREDLINYDKLLRLTYRFAGNMNVQLRNAISLGILAKQQVPAIVRTYRYVRDTIEDLERNSMRYALRMYAIRQAAPLAQEAAVQMMAFKDPTLGHKVLDMVAPDSTLGHVAIDMLVTDPKVVAMRAMQSLAKSLQELRLIDLVNYLLAAKGYYVAANTIVSHTTNAVVFMNTVSHLDQPRKETFEYLGTEAIILGRNMLASMQQLRDESAQVMNHPRIIAARSGIAHAMADPAGTARDLQQRISDRAIATAKEVQANMRSLDLQNELLKLKPSILDQKQLASELRLARARLSEPAIAAAEAVRSIDLQETFRDLKADAVQKKRSLVEETAQLLRLRPYIPPTYQASSAVNKPQTSLLKTIGKEALMFFGPSVYRSSAVSFNYGVTVSASVIEESGFMLHRGLILAPDSSLSCLFDFYNRGGIYGFARYESVRDRYDYSGDYTGKVHIFARDNYQYAPFVPVAGLVFNVRNCFVAKGAGFIAPVNTQLRLTGDFIAEDRVLIPGGSAVIDGKLSIAKGAHFDVAKADFQVGSMENEGKFTGGNSNVDIKTNIARTGAEFSLTDCRYIGDKTIWHNNSIINLVRSALNVDKIDDIGAVVKTLNVFIKSMHLDRSETGTWHIGEMLKIETQHIQSSAETTLTAAEGSFYDLVADTAKCLGTEILDEASKFIRDMPAAEALRLALSKDEYSKQSVKTCIEVTTDSTDAVIFSGLREDGAHVIFKTRGLITLPPEFDRARGKTFSSYDAVVAFVATYATYNLPPPQQKKKSFKEKFLKTIFKVFAGASVVCADGGALIASAVLAGLSVGTKVGADHYERQRIRELEAETLHRDSMQRDGELKALAHNERSAQATVAKEWHHEKTEKMLADLEDAKSGRGLTARSEMRTLPESRAAVSDQFARFRQELHHTYAQREADIRYAFARRSDHVARTGGTTVGFGLAAQAGSTGVSVAATSMVGIGGQIGRGQQQVFSHDFSVPRSRTHEAILPNTAERSERQPSATPIEHGRREHDGGDLVSKTSSIGASNTGFGLTNTQVSVDRTKTSAISPLEVAPTIDSTTTTFTAAKPRVASSLSTSVQFTDPEASRLMQTNDSISKHLERLERQKHSLMHPGTKESPYEFANPAFKANYDKAKARYQKLQPQYRIDSYLYHAEIAKLEKKRDMLHDMFAALTRDELEETKGTKVFEQAKELKDLQAAMHSYVAQDLDQKINMAKAELAFNRLLIEQEQRHASGDDSRVKDHIAAVGVIFGGVIRDVEAHVAGFASRHPELVHATALAGVAAAPIAAMAGGAAYALLSADPMQQRMLYALDLALERAGVDQYSRVDIARAGVGAVKMVAAGAAAKYAPGALRVVNSGVKSAVRGSVARFDSIVQTSTFKSPLVFQFEAGRLNAGLPFDALRLRNPFKHVPEKRHKEFLQKAIKAEPVREHFEVASGGIHAYENFAKARDMAIIRANLSEKITPFLQEIGPYARRIYTGATNKGGSSGWRLDFDPISSGKGAHINWWYTDNQNQVYKGVIKIDKMDQHTYQEVLSHFPKFKP